MNAPVVPRYVAPKTTLRDTLLAIAAGAVILGLVIYGLLAMSAKHESANILVGVVIGRKFTPQPEAQVSFSGRHLQGTRQVDGEYLLEVRVDKEQRTYEVPVEKPTYELKKEGDTLEFVRPPSEQK